ncbi:protein translocase subunit SecF [cyanobiont of Ornithocercus magnificus]|nr:protein translocase subunit SecF [cyanobiont of Ornithocercus magnificus]
MAVVTSRAIQPRLAICRQRSLIWMISAILLLLSLVGLVLSWLNPTIRSPLRPGLDFTGGTQIQLERACGDICNSLSSLQINQFLAEISLSSDTNLPLLDGARVQLLDSSQSLALRLPTLTPTQGQVVISALEKVAGPFIPGSQAIDTIGPTLGSQLFRSSLISLSVALVSIAIYISIRFDRLFAVLALIALAHDVLIVCGVFAWLGLLYALEVNSLFAVALLTIAGYSVNDTVVVFDQIRECRRVDVDLPLRIQIDNAVSVTLTRTLYTSGTTLLPLLTLILFGGSTLFWFAVALALGVIVGSWSSIALAPSLLSLRETAI